MPELKIQSRVKCLPQKTKNLLAFSCGSSDEAKFIHPAVPAFAEATDSYASSKPMFYRGRKASFPAPPAQIRTCPLRHTAPPSGVDDKLFACRVCYASCGIPFRPCVRDMLPPNILPLGPALPSSISARDHSPLFAAFFGTMPGSDFSIPYILDSGHPLSLAAPWG